ncbi:uroporphyrinogen-III synthase [Fodinibius sediminis]|uniref:Uroporphyrinogen-III synthase n=1 Tax=Fodinibius sediminis TaxID=1214077 RepID=A0A521DEX4_9BACT|nr:uroporphyrinogen-III synthase [Fodinibius sediminis]SMO70148.1 Uroporphyrinogen-III synthase [Fodinibius sediminis]
MRQAKRNILVTRPLSAQQLEYARILGLEPIIEPALEFHFPHYWDEVLRVINEHPKSDWVFTSANGVKALKELMNSGLQVRPETQLFAVGAKTREALQDLGLDAKIPRKENGKHLAELIIKEGKINSVIYFHGNLSRDEMTDRLGEEGIEVIELEVYETVINPVEVPGRPIAGILFYSPSAVEGFARGAGFEDDLPPLFAIGPTTAKALKEHTDQQVEIAGRPDTEVLLRLTADYLFNQSEDHITREDRG